MDTITHEGYATDPGTELVDLAADLAPLAAELAMLEKQQVGDAGPVDLGRLTGHASDYEWATWLADVLRDAGCSVVEHPGWKTRGRPRSVGPFTPRGVIWHHDASAVGPSPAVAKFIAEQGRPDEGIPAPLSQCWVCAGCNNKHEVGTWHVLAAGRANHAGIGSGWGRIGADMGTSLTIGVETDNTTGEKTPGEMRVSMEIGTAAILAKLRSKPSEWFCGHKEFAKGRKVDPDDIDMGEARRTVARLLGKPDPEPTPPPAPKPEEQLPYPGREHFSVGHKCVEGHVGKVKAWLNDADPRKGTSSGTMTQLKGPAFTEPTERRVKAFQKAHPKMTKGDKPGDVGPPTWRALQVAARAAGA